MSKNYKTPTVPSPVIEVKSKFDAEFRRFGVDRVRCTKFEDFNRLIEVVHRLQNIPFVVCYTDPRDGDLLPINNDDNFQRAFSTAAPLLRLLIQRKGESYGEINGYGTFGKRGTRNALSKLIHQGDTSGAIAARIAIGQPEDFRRVSAIIDVDVVPSSQRRVRLMKNGSDRPLGFYIRDGSSVRLTEHGVEKVAGIFISRLVPGGLAEGTGLLAVNDEVLEVNGIDVRGKTLDQVTDMMVANSANLIITVKPVNQRNNVSGGRFSNKSSLRSATSLDSDEVHEVPSESTSEVQHDDEDDVHDYLAGSEARESGGDGESAGGGSEQQQPDEPIVTL